MYIRKKVTLQDSVYVCVCVWGGVVRWEKPGKKGL